jgi:general secretion pathway protein A
LLEQAGNPSLMTDALCQTLVDHAAGNYRALMTMGDELLHTAIQRKEPQIDEKLYLELYGRRPTKASRPKGSRRRSSTRA